MQPASDRTEDASNEASITYLYLRLGMVAMVVLLAISVVIEGIRAPGCLQTSLSAYFHTPVHSVFVGVLVTIGFCLIVVRGHDTFQDVFLNVAGMLAPVVALVPTTDVGDCHSIARTAAEDTASKALADFDLAGVQNNLIALFLTGVLALVVAVVWNKRRGTGGQPRRVYSVSGSFAVTSLLVVTGLALFVRTNWFERVAHGLAAIAMFSCLAVVVYVRWRASPQHPYGRVYQVIWQGMVVCGIVAAAVGFLDERGVLPMDHTVLVVEIVEIAWFVAFWLTRAHEDYFRDPEGNTA